MNEAMYQDIHMQSVYFKEIVDSARANCERLSLECEDNINSIVFVGSGDSYFSSSSFLNLAREVCAYPVYSLTANEGANHWTYSPDDIVVAISISGETQSVNIAARKARKVGAKVIGVTAHVESSLSKNVDQLLEVSRTSTTRKTPHAFDFTVTNIYVLALIEKLAGQKFAELDTLAERIGEIISESESVIEQKKHLLQGGEHFYFIGSGPNQSTAEYGAAKYWESRGIPGCAFEIGEVPHGPFMLFKPGDVVVILAISEKNLSDVKKLVSALKIFSILTVVITDCENELQESDFVIRLPKITENISPLVTCIPLQWLCYFTAMEKEIDVTAGGRYFPKEDYETVFKILRGKNMDELYK